MLHRTSIAALLALGLTGCPGTIEDPSRFGVDPGDAGGAADAGPAAVPGDAGAPGERDAGGLGDAGLGGLGDAGQLPVDPPPELAPVVLEAEDMALTGYVVDAANPDLIRLPEGGAEGSASATFVGEAGSYQLYAQLVAENDGQPTLRVLVGGVLVFETLYPLAEAGMEQLELGPYPVSVAPGETIVIEGQSNESAWARVDRLELLP